MNQPRIKGELRYVLRPWAVRKRWALFYIFALIVVLIGANYAAEKYRTYSVPSGSVELRVPYVTYLVGEPITFTLTNNFNSAIYITNECPNEPLRVYRLSDGVWKTISSLTPTENCTINDRQIKVDAHSSQSGNYKDWPSLFKDPGKYRIVAYVDYYNLAPYQDFEVIAKPQKQKVYVRAPSPVQVAQPTKANNKLGSPSNTTPSPTPTPTPTPNPAPTLQSYSVSTASGSVQVEYSSSTIYVRKITPASGCSYEGGRSGGSVELQFKCGGNETTIKLWMSNGKIQQKIEN